MTDLYRLAEKNIRVTSVYPAVHSLCRDYRTEGEADFEVVTTGAEIAFEREKTAREARLEGLPIRQYEEPYLETLAVYRPADGAALKKTLALVESLAASVSLWRLGCNMEIEAAKIAYNAMKG